MTAVKSKQSRARGTWFGVVYNQGILKKSPLLSGTNNKIFPLGTKKNMSLRPRVGGPCLRRSQTYVFNDPSSHGRGKEILKNTKNVSGCNTWLNIN